MLDLEFELIAILILTAVLGLLMGRFLCKSGENDEREKKNKIIHAFKASQNELEINRAKIIEQSRILQETQDIIAGHEQEINNFSTKLLSSDTQRGKLLDELKALEKYKSRFESLNREFKLQSKILDGIKSEKIADQKEIADFKILTNELKKNIAHLKEKQRESEEIIVNLNERIKEQNSVAQKSEVEQEKKYKEMLTSKEREHETLLQSTNKKYQSQLESKTKAYDELKKELESVKEEYEKFKINHTLETDRLDALESDNAKIYHTLETIVVERDDLLARLRAISSVVGAVGIDKNSKSQPLLES